LKRLKFLVGKRRKRKSRVLAPWLKNKKQIQGNKKQTQGRVYDPTDVAQMYDSEMWQWRRVSQWFKDYKNDYTMS